MLESLPTCPAFDYSHVVHSLEGTISVIPELNYITNIILKLKAELAKIKNEVKEIKK